MGADVIVMAVVLGATAVVASAAVLVARRWMVQPGPSEALIVFTPHGPQVTFGSRLVVPFLHRADRVSLSLVRIDVARRGRESLFTAEGMRVDLVASMFIRVNRSVEDVEKAHATFGAGVTQPARLQEYFAPKLTEALKEVLGHFDVGELVARPREAAERVLDVLGTDLSGFVVEDAMLDLVEPTPLEQLDPGNPLDARAIRVATERARDEQLRAAELRADLEQHVARLRARMGQLLIELDETQRRMLTDVGRGKEDVEAIVRRQAELSERLVELVRAHVTSAAPD